MSYTAEMIMYFRMNAMLLNMTFSRTDQI